MSNQENEVKAQLNLNISEVFGTLTKRHLKWHIGKQVVERVKIDLTKDQTFKRMELLGLAEIIGYYKFNDLEIKRSSKGIRVELSI